MHSPGETTCSLSCSRADGPLFSSRSFFFCSCQRKTTSIEPAPQRRVHRRRVHLRYRALGRFLRNKMLALAQCCSPSLKSAMRFALSDVMKRRDARTREGGRERPRLVVTMRAEGSKLQGKKGLPLPITQPNGYMWSIERKMRPSTPEEESCQPEQDTCAVRARGRPSKERTSSPSLTVDKLHLNAHCARCCSTTRHDTHLTSSHTPAPSLSPTPSPLSFSTSFPDVDTATAAAAAAAAAADSTHRQNLRLGVRGVFGRAVVYSFTPQQF